MKSKKDESVYLSFNVQNYAKAKSVILNSEMDLLNSIKHLHNIESINNEEALLKAKLSTLFSSLVDYLEKLEDKLPKNVPKPITEKKFPKKEKKEVEYKKVKEEKISGIDRELLDIQKKLEKLNSYN
ncbi:MAG: hypothetical protein Q7S33_02655 [Nanoarchaeota archaeon]|nr:hypothetical protein [Nanoarchaeota archaeon]